MHFVQYNVIVRTRDGICLRTFDSTLSFTSPILSPFFQNPSSFHLEQTGFRID